MGIIYQTMQLAYQHMHLNRGYVPHAAFFTSVHLLIQSIMRVVAAIARIIVSCIKEKWMHCKEDMVHKLDR